MSKEKRKPYEFLSSVMVSLMNTDALITYHLLEAELRISGKELSAIKKGEDKSIHQYVRTINYIMNLIHLEMRTDVLLKFLKVVLNDRRDLVIGTIPHRNGENAQPVEWRVVMRWDGV